jgi:3-oxoacyl-[acyl-carrier-protein] synthase-3
MPALPPMTIDAVIVATSTPDLTFPSVATMVQAGLGMTRGFAFDVQAVCAGFVFALANADALIRSGQAERVLVIGAETFSKLMDWKIAAPACCSAMAPAPWCWKPPRATGEIAASCPPI